MECGNFDLFGNDTPDIEMRTVALAGGEMRGGSRSGNDVLRGRKYLGRDEVFQLVKAAKKTRNGARDSLMIRLAYEHGLRVSEVSSLRWQNIDFTGHNISVTRAKGSKDGMHPIQGETMRGLKRYQRETERSSGFIFESERGGPVSVDGFRRMFSRLSKEVLGVQWHPHALRHACGVHLINSGHGLRQVQQYMGHANIQNTVAYTALSANAFDNIKM